MTLVVGLCFHWSRVSELYQFYIQKNGVALGREGDFLRDFYVHIPDAEQRILAIGAAWSPSISIVCITYNT